MMPDVKTRLVQQDQRSEENQQHRESGMFIHSHEFVSPPFVCFSFAYVFILGKNRSAQNEPAAGFETRLKSSELPDWRIQQPQLKNLSIPNKGAEVSFKSNPPNTPGAAE